MADKGVFLKGDGAFEKDIVGERSYQEALNQIAGPKTEESKRFECEALIEFEDSNPFDRLAVRISIEGRTVGYLSREDAREFRATMGVDLPGERVFACKAMIVGGWKREDGEGYYGVRIDVPWENPTNDRRSSRRSKKSRAKESPGCLRLAVWLLLGFLALVFLTNLGKK